MTAWQIAIIAAAASFCVSAVVSLALYLLLRPRDKRQRSAEGADLGQLRQDVEGLLTQFGRLAGQIDTRVDSRLELLHDLLGEANRRIAEMREALSHARPAVKSNRMDEIVSLSRQGLSCEQIAEKLQADIGEVELIVNLHRAAQGDNTTKAKE